MNTQEILGYIAMLLIGIGIGAWLTVRFHAPVLGEYQKLVTLAHAERDKLFNVFQAAASASRQPPTAPPSP